MKKLEFDAHERLKSVVKDEKITGGRLGTYTVSSPKSLSTGAARPIVI
jgi:hypothetical protein